MTNPREKMGLKANRRMNRLRAALGSFQRNGVRVSREPGSRPALDILTVVSLPFDA